MWRSYLEQFKEDPQVTSNMQRWATGEYNRWVNKNAVECTFIDPDGLTCHYIDFEPAVVIDHYLRHHASTVKELAQAMVDVQEGERGPMAQIKLEGTKFTEDDRREAVLAALPKEKWQCPFCLNVYPVSSVCRFFLDNGKLSAKVLCRKDAGGCDHTMMPASMLVTRGSPYDYGVFVGAYPGFWKKVDHDKFLAKVKALYPRVNSIAWDAPEQPLSRFWEGYAYTRPEFAEKQRVAKAVRDAKEAGQISEETDQVDESGR